jgi:F1F0 ATPase subunit 2
MTLCMMSRRKKMSELSAILLALLAGGLLGTVFFGGLWWTVKRSVESQGPALLFAGSFLLRMFVAVAGFYFVSHGNWRRLLACLCGFLLARILITRIARLPDGKRSRIMEGGAL